MHLVKVTIVCSFVAIVCGGLVWHRSSAMRRYRLSRELWDAVVAGDAARSATLLDAGADPNVRQYPPSRPSSVTDWWHSLFRRSPDSGTGQTTLICAVAHRNTEVVGRLLASGADPNGSYGSGYSPLIDAASDGDDYVVYMLLKAGADPNATAVGTDRPVEFALCRCSATTVRALLSHGARLDPMNRICVGNAATNPDPGVLAILLDRGLPMEWTNKEESLLSLACYFGNVSAVKLLLRRGADINRKSPSGLTPLGTINARIAGFPPIGVGDLRDLETTAQFLKSHRAKP